jgi:hypothetical protein
MKNVVMYDATITRRVKSRPDRPPTITRGGEGLNLSLRIQRNRCTWIGCKAYNAGSGETILIMALRACKEGTFGSGRASPLIQAFEVNILYYK